MKLPIINQNCPWWKFWNPHSGMIGGLIFGTLIGAVIWLAIKLFH